ncbi:hypothetical protein [uncultured Paracoccus sp.]
MPADDNATPKALLRHPRAPRATNAGEGHAALQVSPAMPSSTIGPLPAAAVDAPALDAAASHTSRRRAPPAPDLPDGPNPLAPQPTATMPRQPGLPLPHRGATMAEIEARVLSHLSHSPTEENALIRDIGMPLSVLTPVLLRLELAGRLARLAGGRLALL